MNNTKNLFSLTADVRRPHLNLGQRKSAFTLAEGGRSPLLNLVLVEPHLLSQRVVEDHF